MLKGIPAILGPDLLRALCAMGHSDRLVIADGNFPAETMGKDSLVIRMDGHEVMPLLSAILKVFPLNTYTENPVLLMEKVVGDATPTPIWDEFFREVERADARGKDAVAFLERFTFYEAAKKASLIIATSETALYANIILQKGVVIP